MIKKAVYFERSPAKINLFLKILDKRQDNYHNLETLFQAVNLEDHLTFEILLECGQSDDIDFEVEIDSNSPEIAALGADNLISKAIEKYFTLIPHDQIIKVISTVNISIFVDKKIPLGAGLAGGSGNAAATLRVLNKFFQENFNWSLSPKELRDIASEIGSDVPFCVASLDKPRQYATNLGDVFSLQEFPFNYDDYANIILVKPNFSIATADAYQLFDQAAKPASNQANQPFFNDFESVILEKYPVIHSIKQTLIDIGCDYALLSGSGSSVIGFVHKSKNAHSIYVRAIQEFPDDFIKIECSFLY